MFSPMQEVPDAVIHMAFDHLGPRDLCRASAVCQRWRALNRDAAANQVRSDCTPACEAFMIRVLASK